MGKVGTESPSFIEPIASRKDGIQAMFLRQKQAQTSRVRETQKRKRSSSSSPSRPAVEPNDLAKAGQPLSKKSTGDADMTELDVPPTLVHKTKVIQILLPRRPVKLLIHEHPEFACPVTASGPKLNSTIRRQGTYQHQRCKDRSSPYLTT